MVFNRTVKSKSGHPGEVGQPTSSTRQDPRIVNKSIIAFDPLDGDISDIPRLTIGTTEVQYRSYGSTVLFVLLATAVGWLGRHFFVLTDLAIVYLYVIVVSALLFSRGPAFLASILSVFAFDFFFVPPVLQINIDDVHYLFTFGMMFLVGLLVANLGSRIRREQRSSIDRERRTAALYSLSRALGSSTEESQAALYLVQHTATVFGANSALLMPDSRGAVSAVANMGAIALGSIEQLAIAATYERGLVAGRGTEDHSGARIVCVPLAAAGATIGVLAVELSPSVNFGLPQREVLEAFGRQGGVCIAGLRSADEVKSAEMRAHTEAVRSALLSAVSHDFRTPLAVITEAATMLRDDAELLSPSQREEMVATVCDEAERMDRLIANLLDMTRLQSGEIVIQRDWVPCEELVGAALNIVKNKTAHLTIRTDVPSGLPLVAVDASLIEQLLANLFENAVKYAGAHATVDIVARADDSGLVIEIADDGPGIPIGTEERVFEKFFRASPNKTGGSGLGLAICRAIIEIHGGTIDAANRDSGGAVFRIQIPIVGTPPELTSERESRLLD